MFIRFHPQTFALKTMSVGALSVLTGNLVKNIFHQTVTPKHFLLALFYYTFIFLILFSVYSFRIEITEKQVTCYYSFQKKVLPIQNLRISTQHIYQGIPNPFPVHILQNGHEKIEIPYFTPVGSSSSTTICRWFFSASAARAALTASRSGRG